MFRLNPGNTADLSTLPEYCPIFILPDVSGDCASLVRLAAHLQEITKNKVQIYLWHDPIASTFAKSLSDYANHVAAKIREISPFGPIKVAGYSNGAAKAYCAAQILASSGLLVSYFNIDAPSIELSQGYFQAGNAAATEDLVRIFNYLGKIVCHHMNAPTSDLLKFPDIELKSLSQQQIETQLEYLKSQLLLSSPNHKALLTQYCDAAMQNLLSLLAHGKSEQAEPEEKESLPALRPLAQIGIVTSPESNKKYLDVGGSWEEDCNELFSQEIPDSTHESLISQHSHLVAEHMLNYFKSSLNPQQTVQREKMAAAQCFAVLKFFGLEYNTAFHHEMEILKMSNSPTESPASTNSNSTTHSPLHSPVNSNASTPSKSDHAMSFLMKDTDMPPLERALPPTFQNQRNNSEPSISSTVSSLSSDSAPPAPPHHQHSSSASSVSAFHSNSVGTFSMGTNPNSFSANPNRVFSLPPAASTDSPASKQTRNVGKGGEKYEALTIGITPRTRLQEMQEDRDDILMLHSIPNQQLANKSQSQGKKPPMGGVGRR